MHNPSPSIEQLIVQVRAGDETAFAELSQRLGPELRLSIEPNVPSSEHRSDAEEIWERTLNQAWREFSKFNGTSDTELKNWLRKTILNQLSQSSADGGNLETIAPQANQNTETLVNKPPRDGPNATPQVSTASDPEPATLSTSPSSVTWRDANQGTVVNQPSKSDQRDSESTEADPLATISNVSDPLATIPPGGDATLGDDPLATMAEGGAARPPSQPPVRTFGHFDILETIAKGGMGVVYKARDRKLNRIVALKMILAGQFAYADDVERFYDEAKAAAHLNHVNIVGIFEVGEYEEQHYISMRFVEGQSLADLVRDHPLHPRAASKYMKAIAEAMQYAHDEGILHRDLKPSNILVDGNNVPLVTDFGLAKLNPHDSLGDDSTLARESQKTMDGTPIGTPSFMPPEQAAGRLDEVSVRSDVYSLGATLYDLLTGKPPFGAANVHETLRQVIEAEPVAPRVLNANVPKDLETICLKCLLKSPARRYASAQQLADELRRYLAGEPILARPVGFVERTIRWCYRNPWPTTAICASVCGLIVATVLWQTAVVARNDADAANATAQKERAEAVLARDQAKASRSQLFVAINKLFTTWGNVKLLNEPALADVRKELLTAVTELYTDIGKQLGNDLELQQELGVSYYQLAQMMFHMEAYREADAAIAKACEIQRRSDLTDVANQERLGESLTLSGSVKLKLSHMERDPDQRLVVLDEAEGLYLEALKVRQRMLARNPTEIEFRRHVWNVEMNLGSVYKWKGEVIATAGDESRWEEWEAHYAKAKKQFEDVQKEREALLARNSDFLSVRHDLAQGSYNLANVSRLLLEYVEAAKHNENAVREFLALLDIESDDLQNRFDLARCEQQAGEIADGWIWFVERAELRPQHYRNAVRHFENAIEIYDVLDLSSPAIVTRYKIVLGGLYARLGDLHVAMDNLEEARKSAEMAVRILEPLGSEHPNSLQVKAALEDARGLHKFLKSISDPPEGAPTTPEDAT